MYFKQEPMVYIRPEGCEKIFKIPKSATKRIGTLNNIIDCQGVPDEVIPLSFSFLPPRCDANFKKIKNESEEKDEIEKMEEGKLNKIYQQHKKDKERILELFVEYYHNHPEQKISKDLDYNIDKNNDFKKKYEITEWDKKFFSKLDGATRTKLMFVANYLDYKHLLNSCGKYFASLIKEKSPQEIREILGIANKFY